MYVMEGHAGNQNQTLYIVLLIVLVTMSLVFGQSEIYDQEPIRQKYFNEYLSCYRCLFETKELGCLLGSDTCLVPKGSSCITLLIKNNSGFETMVSDCRSKEQMSDCSYTRASPVFGFWIFSRCCFQNFCNNPQKRSLYVP
ncbi:PREDICTED: lymphocyte antigen 6 complex locus protein G5c [Bison bison bison]|uniref:Lymphocyte antigen 6 complex locus protein G5c n=2 Tax=Bovinae TaxID=27592 RepID=A0A6P3GJ97_BISBB|nr:PREDICTED: lymphocyte antigen 6 complex locus protein G5c [Bos mutus]XP_010831658.1 PREDICTED: lymphocyte antigen 6 complex locus protein G5c [Bison bison bison]